MVGVHVTLLTPYSTNNDRQRPVCMIGHRLQFARYEASDVKQFKLSTKTTLINLRVCTSDLGAIMGIEEERKAWVIRLMKEDSMVTKAVDVATGFNAF